MTAHLIVQSSEKPDRDTFPKRYLNKSLRSIEWHGSLRSISVEERADNGQLEMLVLRANIRYEKEFKLHVQLSDLVTLNLSNNSLSSFPSMDLLKHLPSLTQLNLSHNDIENIPHEALALIADFGKLQELDLSNNKLKSLPKTIGLLTTLTVLNLACNSLIELPEDIICLTQLTDDLKSFNIKGNKLVRPPQKLTESGGWRTIRWVLAGNLSSLEDEFWIKFNEDSKKSPKWDKYTEKKLKGYSFQVKLQVLGSRGAGKTRIAAALMCKPKATVDNTSGAKEEDDDNNNNNNNNDPRHRRPTQRQFSSNSSNNDDDGYNQYANDSEGSGNQPEGLTPLAPATPLPGREVTPLSRVRTTSSSSAAAAFSAAASRQASLDLAIHNWHPSITALDKFLTTQCVPAGQVVSKHAARISNLTHGATYSCRIWDLSGSLSSSFTVQRLLMTDFSLFLIVWDLRRSSQRDWEDHVVRYIRFVLSSGVSNFRIVITGSHADCLDNAGIMANIYELRIYLSSLGYMQHIESIILPYGEGDDRKSAFLSAQMAYVLVTHSTKYMEMLKAVRKDDNRIAQHLSRPDTHYCLVQDRNRVLQRQMSPLAQSPLEYTKPSSLPLNDESRQVRRAEEEALSQAASLVRVGEAVSFQLLRQDLLIKVDWLIARLKCLLERSTNDILHSSDKSAVFSREAIEDILCDPAVHSADHKKLLRCLLVSLGILVPITTDSTLASSSAVSPQLRSADDMSVGNGALRLFRNRHLTDDLGGSASDPWINNAFFAPTYLIPLLLPALPADKDFCKPGYLCLERRFLYSHPSAVLPTSWFTLACLKSVQQCMQTPLAFFSWKAWDRAFLMEVKSRLDVHVLVTLEELGQCSAVQPSFGPPICSSSSDPPGMLRASRSYASLSSSQSQSFKLQPQQPLAAPPVPPPPPPPLLSSHTSSSPLPPQTPMPRRTHSSMPGSGGSVIRIRAFCHPLHTQSSLRVLKTFCTAMHSYLAQAHDLRKVFSDTELSSQRSVAVEDHSNYIHLVVTCPECLQSYCRLHTAHDSDCGQFSYDEIQLWEKEFHIDMSATAPMPQQSSLHSGSSIFSAAPTAAGGGGPHKPLYDKSMAEFFYHLSKRRIFCPKRRCAVKPEMLFDIPNDVQRFIEQSKQYTQTSRFLTDEVIRRGMQKDHACAVKIMVVTMLDGSLSSLLKSDGSDRGRPATSELVVSPMAVCSGVMCSVPIHRGENSGVSPGDSEKIDRRVGSSEAVFVVTCEHVMTEGEFDQVDRRYHYKDKFQIEGVSILFLVGDENEWLYLADLVYRGSTHPAHAKRFHDYCVLRLLYPIRKQSISTSVKLVTIHPYPSQRFGHVGVETVCVCTGPSPHDASVAHDTLPLARPRSVSGRRRLLRVKHPQFAGQGTLAVVHISTRPLTGDQCVCLLSYPQNKSLSVDFGRILQHDPKDEDILLEVLSDRGSSGGPLLDVYGQVVGVLSRSYNTIKYSFVQPIRELPAILSSLQHLFSLGE